MLNAGLTPGKFTNDRYKKTPLRVFIVLEVLVAGAGFEPTTFGL